MLGGWKPKSDIPSLVEMYLRKVRVTTVTSPAFFPSLYKKQINMNVVCQRCKLTVSLKSKITNKIKCFSILSAGNPG